MRKLHVMNAAARDALIQVATLAPGPAPALGAEGKKVSFRRFLAATEEGSHHRMQVRFGDDYGQALVAGDPEVDLERIGRRISATDTVYLASNGEVLQATPQVVEDIFGHDGSEKLRRVPEDSPANVAEELPVRWTGRKMKRREAVRKFAFKRTMQLRHVDGLTYDFLYAMAKELHEGDQMVLLGAGPDGKAPLIFSTNGLSFRGFLEGRVDGPRYQLLLHLSNLELRRPV